MSLTVTVLGSSGTFAHAGNSCSGYLVRSTNTTVWVDAGPGTLGPLQEHVAITDLDALVLSHEHPDHWLELPVLRNALKYVLHHRGLRVLGTAENLALAEQLIGDRLDPEILWEPIHDQLDAEVGDLRFRFSTTDHPVPTYGMRIEGEGRVLGYTADTGPGWSLAALDRDGTGFDLAVCEATLEVDEAGLAPHISGREAGAMARAAGVRRLVITHLMAGAAERRQAEVSAPDAFGAPVEVALPGRTFEV
ncbi:MAG: metal-dependent hydrolase, beta-lactamase superfamily [Acidimicrobiales bacterium]|nr:metal-dependent hydrolase, beta-lactamase superfamily [Acidimicrobiales bacterium]